MQNWDVALEDLQRLKDIIDSNVSFATFMRMDYNRNWICLYA